MIYAVFAAWVCYACFEGWREAYYFHYKVKAGNFKDHGEHARFFIQRSCVALVCVGVLYAHGFTPLQLAMFGAALGLAFPFLHDGWYYLVRNNIDNNIYPLRFRDQSTTSTAVLTKFFTWPMRLITFIVAGALIVVVM